MSKLVHLCLTCEHPQAHHSTREAAYKVCRCCRQNPDAVEFDPEPTLRPTFDATTHELMPLHKPGTMQNEHSFAHRERLCGCERCHAAYDAQVGA